MPVAAWSWLSTACAYSGSNAPPVGRGSGCAHLLTMSRAAFGLQQLSSTQAVCVGAWHRHLQAPAPAAVTWHNSASACRQPLAAAVQAAAQQAARDEAGRVRTALEQQHERRLAELRADLQGRLASSEQVGGLHLLCGCLALAEQVGLH